MTHHFFWATQPSGGSSGIEWLIDNLSGFGWERPLLGVSMATFMLGFAGFPLTGGMLGKLYVFSAAYERGWWWLVVIGVLATAVSLYYYLGVVRAMYMRPSSARADLVVAGGSPPPDPALEVAIGVAIAVTIGSFFFVQPLVDLAVAVVVEAVADLGSRIDTTDDRTKRMAVIQPNATKASETARNMATPS